MFQAAIRGREAPRGTSAVSARGRAGGAAAYLFKTISIGTPGFTMAIFIDSLPTSTDITATDPAAREGREKAAGEKPGGTRPSFFPAPGGPGRPVKPDGSWGGKGGGRGGRAARSPPRAFPDSRRHRARGPRRPTYPRRAGGRRAAARPATSRAPAPSPPPSRPGPARRGAARPAGRCCKRRPRRLAQPPARTRRQLIGAAAGAGTPRANPGGPRDPIGPRRGKPEATTTGASVPLAGSAGAGQREKGGGARAVGRRARWRRARARARPATEPRAARPFGAAAPWRLRGTSPPAGPAPDPGPASLPRPRLCSWPRPTPRRPSEPPSPVPVSPVPSPPAHQVPPAPSRGPAGSPRPIPCPSTHPSAPSSAPAPDRYPHPVPAPPPPQPRGSTGLSATCCQARGHTEGHDFTKRFMAGQPPQSLPSPPGRGTGRHDTGLQKIYKRGGLGLPKWGGGGRWSWPPGASWHLSLVAASDSVSLTSSTSPTAESSGHRQVFGSFFTFQHFDTFPINFVFKKST